LAKPQPKAVDTQASSVPTPIATSPAGTLPGKRTPPYQPPRMIASETRPMTGDSNISIAGFIEMKVIEIPASVPRSAARGVSRRMCGATNAPRNSTIPSMNTQARPACQASIGSPLWARIGSMMASATKNMCGTLGPDGSAATSLRPVRTASLCASHA
jgi:hypothetical protein